ncbi:hypothetical protein SRHO_G00317340 [Serrasalmus rhombeus]
MEWRITANEPSQSLKTMMKSDEAAMATASLHAACFFSSSDLPALWNFLPVFEHNGWPELIRAECASAYGGKMPRISPPAAQQTNHSQIKDTCLAMNK